MLSARARSDYRQVLRWSESRFGDAQARRYAELLADAVASLSAGPDVAGAKRREDLVAGVRTLHVARGGHRARHLVVFRVEDADARVIAVLRLLHDAIDIVRHLPPDDPD
ncbi:MAG: type II toxin-antitoxin system RelE/ParE family toxin [Alphaproteobacteria bacterium]